MKIVDELKQLRGLEPGQLATKLKETEKELMHLQFKHASNQLQQTSQLTEMRRRIARIKTVQSVGKAS